MPSLRRIILAGFILPLTSLPLCAPGATSQVTPAPDNENLAQRAAPGAENKIGFAIASGGYFVETNGGGRGASGGPGYAVDPTIAAWRANAAAGATIDCPSKGGEIVEVRWDLDGSGKFERLAPLDGTRPSTRRRLSWTFDRPGTYFVTVRAVSQRTGDANTPYARIQNLDRVRVVVR